MAFSVQKGASRKEDFALARESIIGLIETRPGIFDANCAQQRSQVTGVVFHGHRWRVFCLYDSTRILPGRIRGAREVLDTNGKHLAGSSRGPKG